MESPPKQDSFASKASYIAVPGAPTFRKILVHKRVALFYENTLKNSRKFVLASTQDRGNLKIFFNRAYPRAHVLAVLAHKESARGKALLARMSQTMVH
jgi:hypothetical protein